ncbi:cytochrome c oxidase subunit 2 [Tepidamorphus gemmatus]|jgi:cytochrome c oxidase subunit 2|uniref:Cytochrome c oxidase subunit 2 n=1 Tax=Tepidamorphus gemmatus TaxID=747076 RepID=A0A4R3M8R6_9HYPH|nr:cytochrome c oxidase subunit 2 [Tepidamorphus gemmatus]
MASTRRFAAVLATASAMATAATAALAQQPRDWQLGLQPAGSPVMESIISFHNMLLVIITLIVLFVLALLTYCILRFNAARNPVPSRTSHNTLLEVAWTVIPVLILVIIAIPSFRLLYFQMETPEPDVTIKTTGYQWYWSYEYPDHGISFDSLMLTDDELQPGQPRLLAVDNEMVVPVGKVVKLLVTADPMGVIHSWTIPSFGSKVDAVPGRMNETWFRAEKTGVYYGQCSELCGRDHAFMPIAVRVVTQEEYEAWIQEQTASLGKGGSAVASLRVTD